MEAGFLPVLWDAGPDGSLSLRESRSLSGPFVRVRNGSGEDVSEWPRNQEILFSEIHVEAIFALCHISSENGLACLSNVAGRKGLGHREGGKLIAAGRKKPCGVHCRERFYAIELKLHTCLDPPISY